MKRTPIVCISGFSTARATHAVAYDRLANVLDGVGFEAHFPEPDWRVLDPRHWAQTMADYTIDLIDKKDEEPVLFGFSAGAVVAALATGLLERQNQNIRGLASCSLSPWFGPEQVARTLQTANTALSK